ncbi:MAG: hypothetical protein PVI03_07170 [Candidatus Thorarchaeota archaeon]|jgi:hypothetical protein
MSYKYDANLLDADSLIWKAGSLSEKKVWYVYRDDEEVEQFDMKSDLNKWLKDEHSLSSRKFSKTVEDDGTEIHTLDDWRLEGIPKLEPLSHCLQLLKVQINGIMKKSLAKKTWLYVSTGRNYRYEIYPRYKESRANTPKPKYYYDMLDYLMDKYDVVDSKVIEADDAVCIAYNEMKANGISAVISHIDKDIEQLPGNHYNWDWELVVGKDAHYKVSKMEGRRSFFMQMLTGDSADSIPGIKGVGKATALKMLGSITELDEYIHKVQDAYAQAWPDEDHEAYFERNALLLFMLREPYTGIENIDWRKWV